MHRRLYTPRQRRSHRRRQLLRDLVLGAVVVAVAQIVAPRLPFVQQLEAQQVAPLARVKPPVTPTLVGTSPAATAQTPPALTTIEHDRGR